MIILYLILGYWATGKTIFANKIIIHAPGQLFFMRFAWGMLLGWLLIPWAILKLIFCR